MRDDLWPGDEIHPGVSSVLAQKKPAEILVRVGLKECGLGPLIAGKGADPDIVGIVGIDGEIIGQRRVIVLKG